VDGKNQMFRNFPPHIEALANETDSIPFVQETWTVTGQHTPTANAAVPVVLDNSGRRAFAKPGRPCDRDCIFAAHEKISSDLARKLVLPIPPVHLARPAPALGFPNVVAMSYVPFPQPRRWSERVGLLTDGQVVALRPAAAAMRVFHTWIVDQDHAGNDGNVIIDVLSGPPPQPAIAFIDHSYSMTYGWQPGQQQPMQPAPIFHDSFMPIDNDATREAIDRINALNDDWICSTIDRVSDDAMPPALRAALAQFLCERKVLLRTILNV
jgi:hypothetical protein